MTCWSAIAGAQTTSRKIYVANYASDSLSVFPLESEGNVASLFGSNGNIPSLFTKIQLSNPSGIAFHAGNLYVANHSNDSITVYPANTTERPKASATIHGSKTQLNNPNAIAVDSAGTIYVFNEGAQGDPAVITSYAAGSDGNVAPKAVIKGPNTRLDSPTGIALDSHGNIYIANQGSWTGNGHEVTIISPSTITIYSPGSTGNVRPARTLSGSSTRLKEVRGIAVDSAGYIYASSDGTAGESIASILIFAPNSDGNVAPITSIDTDCAELRSNGPLAFDSNGHLYAMGGVFIGTKIVAYQDILLEPGAGRSQCVSPTSSFSVDKDGSLNPSAFAVDQAGDVITAISDSNSLMIFRAGANDNNRPSATLTGETGIVAPTGIALDASGKIYVANDGIAAGQGGSDDVTIYPAGSNANVPPIGGGSNYSSPQAIAVAPDGTTYVANGSKDGISIFGPGPDGKLRMRTIVNGVDDPSGVAVDHGGNLYVVNYGGQSIKVYGPRADGEDPPIRVISGDKTRLDFTQGIAVDAAGKIYVSIGGGADSADAINVYAPDTKGNVAPIAIISGPKTQLKLPQGIAGWCREVGGKVKKRQDPAS
jgi:sugar lactone lactonase YvrE